MPKSPLETQKEPSPVESLAQEALREYNINVKLGKIKQQGASTTGLEGYALEGDAYRNQYCSVVIIKQKK